MRKVNTYPTKGDIEFGFEIKKEKDKVYFRGFSTDWCWYPAKLILYNKLSKEVEMVWKANLKVR